MRKILKIFLCILCIVGILYAIGNIFIDKLVDVKTQEKTCNSGDVMACTIVGTLYLTNYDGTGQDTKANYEKSKEYYKKACDLKAGDICTTLGMMYLEDGDNFQATKYFSKGCDLKSQKGCKAYEMIKQGKI